MSSARNCRAACRLFHNYVSHSSSSILPAARQNISTGLFETVEGNIMSQQLRGCGKVLSTWSRAQEASKATCIAHARRSSQTLASTAQRHAFPEQHSPQQAAAGFATEAAEGGSAARLRRTSERAKRLAAARQRAQAGVQRAETALAKGETEQSTEVAEGGEEAGPLPPAVQASTERASALQVADVVNHPALIVTRNIEWGTVILGFEQCNQYTILDQDGNVVALMAEDDGIVRTVGRQLLRTRRPFVATVFSPDGEQVLFRVRRPFKFINSKIRIEDGSGEVLGEVTQRWHLWKRNYDLYLGNRQFAEISSGLLAWEFLLKDANGEPLALIDRNWSGFGKELFTDAGKYVIHFGDTPAKAAEQVANTVAAAHPDKPRPNVTALAQIRTDVQVLPTSTGNQLVVARPLELSERMLVLAAAISVDFDYFSQHSHAGSPGMLPFFMPMPIPEYPPPDAPAPGGPGGAEAAGAEGAAGAGAGPPPPGAPSGEGQGGLEGDLGGDKFEGDGAQQDSEWSWDDKDGSSGDGDNDLSDGGGGDGGGLWDSLTDLFES